jgi:hypothetical protein
MHGIVRKFAKGLMRGCPVLFAGADDAVGAKVCMREIGKRRLTRCITHV